MSQNSQLMIEDSAEQTPARRGFLHRTGGKRHLVQTLFFTSFRIAAAINALALLIIFWFLIYNGLPAINWSFLSEAPRRAMTEGGILPCIVGTVILGLGSMLVAFPLGVATAIYLNEYAKAQRAVRIIKLGINNLAGVPSVVFGLFGLSFFVIVLGMGVSVLSGILTLGFLTLPVIIGASKEALLAVPQTYREASLALGATRFQTITRVVLPAALPGMLTGSILGISRAAGETAAIMFTAAVFFTPVLPQSIFDPVMALPYHIYVLATAGTNIELTRPKQYGTALVLIGLVFSMNIFAIWLRARLQKKH
ncbi:phosphate ABC transporter, inner membrane subunit PstA [Alkalidesulfovibrio alkalitolerans DSM 16529]|uniref:Phosphate transport system permease protein PstA n=1 Tax=Alkalidesulfovibrio alkalitolerans DSM 16529 TaxID=1121439 RepID=S7TI31_9BACT|nr:phosphate ABC transporter permease PstA [Alkalidesulfovibrio alkalitolerans]EPR36285.1 phosphate ABC transporter, inner membrane subunit PstA [Alkalidesulfovibrio alkalitolerans DSM 16529]